MALPSSLFEALNAALRSRPLVMGVLNVTPDSFSDGGRWLDVQAALAHAEELFAAGADLVDVGGESTRPGAAPVDLEEELRRVLPVAEGLARRLPGRPWSVDTQKAELARRAVELGACLINDISALRADPAMPAVVAASGAGVCLMHRLERPAEARWSTEEPERYGPGGVTEAVLDFLAERIHFCESVGIARERIWVDPGLGFGKSVADNLRLLKQLPRLNELRCPILVGPSRKSFLGAVTGGLPVEERLEATLAACTLAAWQGAAVLRVHDVKAVARVAQVVQAIKSL
jgi:dihydropteroate synthase